MDVNFEYYKIFYYVAKYNNCLLYTSAGFSMALMSAIYNIGSVILQGSINGLFPPSPCNS